MSNLPQDTILLSPELIQHWQSQGYDYDREFAKPEPDPDETTEELKVSDPSKDIVNYFQRNQPLVQLIAIIFLVVFAVTLGFMLRHNFSSPARRISISDNDEDDIYSIDFDRSLEIAEQERNYRQCIRLRYLHLLRLLQDNHFIQWLPGKTTTQYAQEFADPSFAELTQIFVRVRYGNYEADARLNDEFLSLIDDVNAKVKAQKESNVENNNPQP